MSKLLGTLAHQGFIHKVDGRLFALSHSVLLLGDQAILKDARVHHGRRIADELSRTVARPTYIGIVWQGISFLLYQLEPDGSTFGQPGKSVRESSVGKVMTTFDGSDDISITSSMTQKERTAWYAELDRVRETGYALAGQDLPSVAAPVREHEGNVVAALATEASDVDSLRAHLVSPLPSVTKRSLWTTG